VVRIAARDLATVNTANGAESSVRRESEPGVSRVREKTSNGPAKSSTSTPSKIRMPTFHRSMAISSRLGIAASPMPARDTRAGIIGKAGRTVN
jgi:hypothetical protein